ncbi:DinB family protein [Virgibacillus flavescens]|uniref:DinB family protein n=1 Tax=Virgibacillus flavescens TaxID=1611422 RepID=UPI003D32B8C4
MMKEEQIFEQMKMWRSWTVEMLKTIPEEVADKIPHGHTNNIRWNAGHILVSWDYTMLPAVNKDIQTPSSYNKMFARGTKPQDWTEQSPTMEEIIKQLEEQPNHTVQACKGHLNDPLKESFLAMETLGDMAVFHMNHENLHVGIINSMKKFLLK